MKIYRLEQGPRQGATTEQLELEAHMLRALVQAGWPGETIAAWMAAQRLDGVLARTAPDWLVDVMIGYWREMPPGYEPLGRWLDEGRERLAKWRASEDERESGA